MKKNSVFISSVYSEFCNVRQDVINAVLQSGDLPICMERFNSSFGNTAEILKRYIAECDYFIMLIGKSYGDIEPDSGLGYTEFEYNVALQLGLKPMVFLMRVDEREPRTNEFIKRIQEGKQSLWYNWDSVTNLVASVISSLNEAELNDPRDGWIRGGTQIESCSSAKYTDFVLAQEKQSNELIILPKRLNTAYKPESMIRDIAEQRYGHGIDKTSYDKYISGHMTRSKQFFDYLDSGKLYYELFNKCTLIEYVQGMHHNGIKSLNIKYMTEMLERWKATILAHPKNYFIGLVDAVLPFKYEIFDRKIVSMHETVGQHSKNRVSALIIKEPNIVQCLVNDFETMWDTLAPEECEPEKICEWIDTYLIGPLKKTHEMGVNKSVPKKNIYAFGFQNCRDLGGMTTIDEKITKFGYFYRADMPTRATPEDILELKEKNITLCLDVRHLSSTVEKPSIFKDVNDLEYEIIGYTDENNLKIAERVNSCDFDSSEWERIFIDVLEKERSWIKKIFDKFANNEGGIIFHCTLGRDRTGLLSMLLLMLCGVKDNEIIADYVISNIYCSDEAYKQKREVSPITIEKTMKYIKEKYFAIENYLFSCGISLQDMERIRRKLVD